ncbi:MAG: hypothetical protein IPK07_22660 [Deltaproteobacteria bacterium]|nr:hypothetical protein [Deltaproteobacteria bacterium]
MASKDPSPPDRAHERWLELERRRAAQMESAEFLRTVQGLLDGLDVEIFEEDWQQVTIINRAKEMALMIHVDGGDFATARRDLEVFYVRKRRFFLDEDEEAD